MQKLQLLRDLRAEKQQREAERLTNLDVFGLLGYTPHEKQREFHAATEFDVLYGGAAGGGKSAAIVMEGIRAAARYPGLRVLLIRRTYDELAESIFPVLAKYGYAEAIGATWNGSERELRFPNRSVIRYRYMETLVDASRRQGGEYQLLLVDESTLMPPGVVDILKFERLRTGNGLPVIGVRSTCNPGGPSHSSVKTRYIEATNHGAHTVTDEHGLSVRFIQAKATDNPHLDAGYHHKLAAIPDPSRRAAMRDGDWDQFAGMVFREWRRDRHVVDPFTLPVQWRRYVGVDYGYVAPFAAVWGAIDNDRRLWLYRDLSATQVIEADQARMIRDAQAPDEHVTLYAGDPSMWAKKGEADPPAHVYAREGVPLEPANNDRIIGWHRLHSFMADGPACELHRAQGWERCPMMHVFSTCSEVTRTLPALPHATKGNPEDADTTADDHICLIAGTLVATRRGEVPIELVTTSDEVMTRRGWRRVLASGLTGVSRPVVTLATSDGRLVTVTPNHPVWTENRGWVAADGLRYSDILVTWPRGANPVVLDESKRSTTTASHSAGTQIPNERRTARTSPRSPATAIAVSTGYTAKYGKTHTVPSLMATTSTIATTTPATMRSTTSTAFRTRSITSITAASHAPTGSASRLSRSDTRPQSGMAATKAGLGTAITVSESGKAENLGNSPASGAKSRSRPETFSAALVSVPTSIALTPGRPAGSMTRTAPAMGAGTRSGSISTRRPAPAPVFVAGRYDAGKADVYNLTVEDESEFFANGVLVHNCDATRYLIMAIGTEPRFHFPPSEPAVTTLDPNATGPTEPKPLPTMFGGYPVLNGGDPWG